MSWTSTTSLDYCNGTGRKIVSENVWSDKNEMTFDLYICHAGSTWLCLGQSEGEGHRSKLELVLELEIDWKV